MRKFWENIILWFCQNIMYVYYEYEYENMNFFWQKMISIISVSTVLFNEKFEGIESIRITIEWYPSEQTHQKIDTEQSTGLLKKQTRTN